MWLKVNHNLTYLVMKTISYQDIWGLLQFALPSHCDLRAGPWAAKSRTLFQQCGLNFTQNMLHGRQQYRNSSAINTPSKREITNYDGNGNTKWRRTDSHESTKYDSLMNEYRGREIQKLRLHSKIWPALLHTMPQYSIWRLCSNWLRN